MSVDNTKVSVFVGFGGTGGKVLRELASLVAADDAWRKKAPSHLYLVLCDTDEDELSDSANGIRALFPDRGHRPVITEIALADGLGAFGQTVRRQWEAAAERGGKAVERLQGKWWCDEGEPFTAHRVPYNIDEGAGQCPMVSYFLAWWQGAQIRQKVDALAAEIDARIPHGGDRPPVELTIVNSLAGGTGRGSWTVLSFLIRRELERRGWHPAAIGLFLDQGCFAEVMESRPEQRFKMKINSLTGLSEVVMWTRIDDKGKSVEKPKYHLPDFSSPEREELDLIRDFNQESGVTASPLGYAQIIFAAGRSGGLPSMSDYYGVAASALYAQLSMPAIKSQQQNAMPRVGGVGSARVAVPFVEIERFVKNHCIKDLLDGASTDDPEDGVDLDSLLGAFAPELNKPGTETSLVSRLTQRLLELASKETAVVKFKEFVANDKPDEAGRVLRMIAAGDRESGCSRLIAILAESRQGPFNFGSMQTGGSEKIDLAALGNKFVASLGRHLEEDLGRLGATRGSAHRLADALGKLREHLYAELRGVLGVQSNDEIEPDPDGLALKSLAADVRKLAGKDFRTMWYKHFDAAERDHLVSKVGRVWAEETLIEVLRSDLIPNVELAEAAVRSFSNNLAFIVERGFGGEWQFGREKAIGEDEKKLFITKHRRHGRDHWNISAGFSESRSSARYGLRLLRPRLDRDLLVSEGRKLRTGQTTPRAIECELSSKLVRFAVQGGPDVSDSDRTGRDTAFQIPELREEHAGKIQRLVHADVDALTHALHVERDWLEKHFAFDRVIESQMVAWQEEFEATSGPAQSALRRDFELFYGISPDEGYEGKPMVPETRDVLRALVLTTAKSCEPMMQIRSGHEPERRQGDLAMASVPSCFGKGPDSPAFKELIDAHRQAGIAGKNWVFPSTNPYVLTVYTNQAFSHSDSGDDDSHFRRVRSLDYWQDADEDNIADWLARSEDPLGASVFSKEMRNSGLGFPDPTVVRDPAFASLRWRPWFRHEEAEREAQAHRAVDAVLYALGGHVGTGSSEETRELVDELLERLRNKERHEWAMPNIRWESRRMWFQRNAVQVRENLPTANMLVRGAPVRLTLTKFVEAISGTDNKTRKAVDGLLEERRHFHEEMPAEIGISTGHFKAIHQGVEDFLVDLELEVSKGSGGDKDAFVSLVAVLLQRHRALRP